MIGLLMIPPIGAVSAATVSFGTLERPALTIRYEEPLRKAAEDLATVFRAVSAELVDLFGWHLSQRPTVMLIQTAQVFRQRAGHPLISAYAVPSENLIVLDYGRLAGRPVQLRSVLKHELVHLFLNSSPQTGALPKWLEEGVAQWASEGVAELLDQPPPTVFEAAVVAGGLMPLSELRHHFPRDDRLLMLAYEESRRAVDYIVEANGRRTLIEFLAEVQRGSDVEAAFYRGIGAFPWEIEKQWLDRQSRTTAWPVVLAGHIYQFLFLLGALLTVAGFVRFLRRKRDYTE
ncbi:MAG: hypothetical protein WAM73_13970 [Desulfobacterales bacterium]